jgi:drug/metabolite transporter (DMT)-like permease
MAGVGAPYVLVTAYGLRFAPAYDQGALNPGCMPLFGALLAATVLREAASITQKLGLSFILAGAILIVGWHDAGWGTSRLVGDALFLLASLLTAGFTVTMRCAKLDPLHAVALVSTGSLVIYFPIYLLRFGCRIAQLPLADVAFQAAFQGIMVTVVSLLLYGRAVAILGASAAAAFGALVPVLSALFAIPLLGEWPNLPNWAGIILISAGAWLASGGPLPVGTRRGRHTKSVLP